MASSDSSATHRIDDLGVEQHYITRLYHRLDALRAEASRRLAATLRATGGTLQARSERDSVAALYRDRVSQYDAVEDGLCFGRLDFDSGERGYIGRIGLFDPDRDYEPLLVDWRAPAARPFYLATAAAPGGVRRRRHIRTRQRKVVGVTDEVLDLAEARSVTHESLTGEAALLAALSAGRTGRMTDIVATIQAEQDLVIRSDLAGVLVVQGGPGTGKTAVALHRAAYLLYTHRRELSTRGVLIVGPNATFLRYISEVLPSLAETGVLLRTPADLYPGVTARETEPPEAAEIKGRLAMVDTLAAAVRDRQRLPERDLELVVDGEELVLERAMVARARDRARASGRPHNLARRIFAEEVAGALAEHVAERIGTDPHFDDPLGGDDAPGDPNLLGAADLADIRADLLADPAVRAAVDDLWPALSPQRLLGELLASSDLIASAAPRLSERERRQLLRRPAADPAVGSSYLDWTPADVPLLDEAAELLGERPAGETVAERAVRERVAYAEGALEIATGSRSIDLEDEADPELLGVADLLDAEALAQRHAEVDRLTAAERAALDRTWAFGHVIVDEAQELSPMAWRMLLRRCPNRSMTVVGDVAQTGDLAGAASWGAVFAPHLGDRFRLAELTVNYRTPAEVMSVAADVLTHIDPSFTPPRSVRQTGVPPWFESIDTRRPGDAVVAVVLRETGALPYGNLGVIVPAALANEVGAAVCAAVPETAVGGDPDLESRVVVLTVSQAKGLEFDSVIVVDPAGIAAESSRGHNDLYVALTRATQRLGVLHPGALPGILTGRDYASAPGRPR